MHRIKLMNSVKHWNKTERFLALALVVTMLLAGCGTDGGKESHTAPKESLNDYESETQAMTKAETVPAAETAAKTETSEEAETGLETQAETAAETETKEAEMTLRMTIGGTAVNVKWEENESSEALKALCKDGPLTIPMSMYGGFEQVGRIDQSLPRADMQTTTEAGDIVLYSGNQLVIFYGSNTWAYTRLGRVTDRSAQEMAELLGNGDVTVTIELK